MLRDRISILAVSPQDEDHRSIHAILQHSNWNLSAASTMAETLRFLEGQDVSVIVCERDLPDGSWKDMLKAIGDHEHAPHLIVVSALADECLWSEVLNLGGYDVLLKPLNSSELFRVLSSAARSWRERRRAQQELTLAVKAAA